MAKMQVNEPEIPVKKKQDEPASGTDVQELDVDVIDDVLESELDDEDTTEIFAEEEEEIPDQSAVPESVSDQTFIKQEKTDKPYWYVVYTYSGYEKRVMANLKKTVQNHGLEDTILDVKVPETDTIEMKNGTRRHVKRKLYPGYVMVKMFLTDDSWYVVRNTRGVTGFVGPASKPIPLSEREVRAMKLEDVRIDLDVEVGDRVVVTDGAFANITGEVESIDPEKQKVEVRVEMFGRDQIPMKLDFVQVKKIQD